MARPPDRDVAAVVADAVLLLERRIVLFVDDDEREPGQRREDREPRAQDEVGLARRGRAPVAQPLARRKAAVQRHRSAAGQRARDALLELRGQIDLGHEDQRLSAGGNALGGRGEIDLGLAASGDALQQERRERAVRLAKRRDGVLLVGVERRAAAAAVGAVGARHRNAGRRGFDPAGGLPASHRLPDVRRERGLRLDRQQQARRRLPFLVQRAQARRATEGRGERVRARCGQAQRRCRRSRRRRDAARGGKRRQHLREDEPERLLVVRRDEIRESEKIVGQRREIADDFVHRLQSLPGDLGRPRDVDDHADERAPRQAHANERTAPERKAFGNPVVERGGRRDRKGDARDSHRVSACRLGAARRAAPRKREL